MERLLWSFDSVVLAAVAADVEPLVGSAVTRVAQPDRDEIVLTLRGRAGQTHVLFSIHPRWARVHLVESARSGTAGSFCQLLRAKLEGARLRQVAQPAFERTLTLSFEHLGEETALIAEIMGRHSNLISVRAGTILGVLKTVTPHMSSVRPVTAGSEYRPPLRDRPVPQELSAATLQERLAAAAGPAARRLAEATLGLSPLLAAELVERAGLDPAADPVSPTHAAAALWPVLATLIETVRARRFSPVVYRRDSTAVGFAPFPYTHLTGLSIDPVPTMSTAVAAVADVAAVRSAFDDERRALHAAITAAIEKVARAEAKLQTAQAEAARAEELQQWGDLLFAYAAQVPPGAAEVTLPGFDGAPVRISLDPAVGAAENARRLFKRLTRIKAAQPEVARRLREAGDRHAYLENALVFVDAATSSDDVRSVRDELIEESMLPARRTPRGTSRAQSRGGAFRAQSSGPRQFTTTTGHQVLVGRTNRENDEVTFKLARADDLWCHARGMPGAHVILRTGGRKAPEEAIGEAAQIAAYFSRGRGAAKVPVSYTLRKYVKKPRGARPGLVTISHDQTVVVEPTLPTVVPHFRR